MKNKLMENEEKSHNAYSQYCKPRLSDALQTLRLDKTYHRASESHLFYKNENGSEQKVIDFLGGYGAALLGHNPNELVDKAISLLQSELPFHAQTSIRGQTGKLAAKLNELLKRETNYSGDFQFIFSNSGAEAVEVALKHAEYQRSLQIESLLFEINENIKVLKNVCEPFDLPVITSEDKKRLGIEGDFGLLEVIESILIFNQKVTDQRPVFLALEKAFHGKLSGSLQVTFGESYRLPFKRLGVSSQFCSVKQLSDKGFLNSLNDQYCYDLVEEQGALILVKKPFVTIAGLLCEPVQGEGGVFCLDAEEAAILRDTANTLACPLIVDEIQSGSGRCGSFLASRDIQLEGDYITLSKALSGGICKVAVTAIKRPLVVENFSMIHSSTFAEDDFSSSLAYEALQIMERNNGELYKTINAKGNFLLEKLSALQVEYPSVIKEVRGRGLFVGVEFHPLQDADSMVFRTLDYQESIGYMFSGYLLNNWHIRVAPPASANTVLRIEPPACISIAEMEYLIKALDHLCKGILYQDSYHLLQFLCQSDESSQLPALQDYRPFYQKENFPSRSVLNTTEGACDDTVSESEAAAKFPVIKVAFINHLIGPEWLKDVDPSFSRASLEEAKSFIKNSEFDQRSAPFPPVRITGKKGQRIDFSLYPLTVSSEQMVGYLQTGNLEAIRENIRERIITAREDGCRIAGLGMFNSIVTNNCKQALVPGIGVTSGNALTVGMGIQAIEKALSDRNASISQQTLVVIGAAGNIASIYATILSEKVEHLVLIGSTKHDSMKRLQKVKDTILLTLSGTRPDFTIEITNEFCSVKSGNIVLCAASVAEPFLESSAFMENAIVCDIAVPHNVIQSVLVERPDIIYMRGGVVSTPNQESLDSRSRAYLEKGQLYACMTESAVMGLSSLEDNYSVGNLKREQVFEMNALAAEHGFTLADYKLEKSF